MTDISLDKVIQDAMALRPEQRQRLIELLTTSESRNWSEQTIEQIAAQQGKSPLDFDEIRKLGSFFPEDDKIDDLVDLVRTLRQDKSERNLN